MISILSMQLRASILILFVVLIRSLFLYKIPKKVFLGMWAVVLARLLIPFTKNISFGFSISIIENICFSLIHTVSRAFGTSTAIDSVVGHIEFTTYPISIPWFLWGIWIVICTAMAAYFVVGHVKGRRIYRFAYPTKSHEVLRWAEKHKIHRNVRILECQELSSALTYGVFRPVILLPSNINSGDPGRLNFILSHEFEHIRHFDILWKCIAAAVLCLNWYNPLVWIMYILFSRDVELHCDECVLKKYHFKRENKSEYALALLALAEEKHTVLPLANHFSRSATQERVLSVMHSRKVPALLIGAALMSIVILGLLSFASFALESGIGATFPL